MTRRHPRFTGLVSLTAMVLTAHAGVAAPEPQSTDHSQPAHVPAPEKAQKRRAQELISKAVAYLKTKQDAATGGWKTQGPGPVFPAVTGLVVAGMMMEPGASAQDQTIASAANFILKSQKPDGGIYDAALPSYNTSICVTALARLNTPESKAAAARAVEFLKQLQFSDVVPVNSGIPDGPTPVGKDHAFYGGVGYGRHGRPDLSNLAWMLDAMHEAGVEGSDQSFQRAMTFLQRTQMLNKTPDGKVVNDMPYAAGSRQGGFIYSTSVNKDQVGQGQSMPTSTIEETLDDGTRVSRLRCYGSMTYSGFKSYLYADLPRDDARVQAAMGWIRDNYSAEINPGMGKEGLYYYYVVMAKALAAWGEPELMVRAGELSTDGVPSKAGDVFKPVRWADDLVENLAALQQPDGSFRSVHERWMENDPVLITAYAVLALEYAQKYQ